MKKVISLFLSFVMLLSLTAGLDFSAYADTLTTGKCGENATYSFDESTKTLTISGTGVIDYSDYDFPSEKSIVSLVIEEGITGIGDWMFFECKNLEHIVFPDSLVSISSGAFFDSKYYNDDSNWQDDQLYINNALIDVKSDGIGSDFVIKDGTTVVGDSALAYLDITSVYVPKSVKGITGKTFFCCNYLKTIDVDPNSQYYISDNGVLFNKDKTVLVGYPKSADNESYSIPDSVKKIGKYAFEDSINLSNLDIPNGVEMIEEYAVDGCDSLTSIVIPNSVTHIGAGAFSSRNLNKIDMSSNIESVDGGAFEYTAYYDDQNNWDNGVLYIGSALIKADHELTGVYSIKESTRVVATAAFADCGSLNSVYIPDGVVAINNSAFYNCSSIRSIIIPATVTTIGNGAFQCTNLSSVYIQGANVTVGDFAFYDSGNNTVIFCCSTTKFGDYNYTKKYYVDKMVSVKNFKDLYDSDYDWDNTVLYSFIANESCTYYSGGECWNFNYIFDENYNLVESQKIDSVSDNESDPTGGFSFQLEKGHTYYFPYGGSSDYSFKIIKDYQYVDTGKQYIQGDFNYDCLNVVYPDDTVSSKVYNGRNNADLNQPVISQFCGKTITFNLNNPVTFDSFEILNGQYIDDEFVNALKKYDDNVIKDYPIIYRLHLSDGTKYDIKDYKLYPGSGETINGNYWSDWRCEVADGREFYVSFTYNENKPNELKIQINSGYLVSSPSLTVDVNAHTHIWSSDVLINPTCTTKGTTRYTCSLCGDSYDEEDIDALGHNYVSKVVTQPTCTQKGVTRYTCSHCGDSYDEENIDAFGHTYKQTVTPATTSKDGNIVKKCSVCGAVSTVIIAKASSVSLSSTSYTYNGSVKTPSVTVKNSKGKALTKGKDYTVTYSSGRKNVGKYSVKITFKGNYSGTVTKTFTVKPKATSVNKLTALKGGIKVYVNKQATKTTGYQIQYSTSSSFANAKTATIGKNTTLSKSITGLAKGKKYYVRVRTYKTVNGTKYYSSWSKAKSVTTKK